MCLNTNIDPNRRPGDGRTASGAASKCCPPPPWMPIAWAEEAKNVDEDPPGNDPNIMKYHQMAKYGAASESTSWCGSFVAWSLSRAGVSPLSTVPERALSWGRPTEHENGWWPGGISIGRPIYGAIAVKQRSGGGHVTFVVGEDADDPTQIHCLGGNQGDRLTVSKYKITAFHAFMVPKDYPHQCCVLPVYDGTSTKAESEG